MILPIAKDYPSHFNVKDEVYEIRMVSRIPGENKTVEGMCDDGAKIIWIRKNQSPRGLLRTLVHELFHALDGEYNLRLRHEQVWKLETAVEAFLTDNFFIHEDP
jgi:Zn-dependent peptidase ImmA (M78 family)